MKKRSYKRKSKRSYKRKSKRSYKRKSKRSYKRKLPKFNLIIDYGIRYNSHSIDSGINYDFKLIELEGCDACKNAKKLIKDKGYSVDVKKELNSEEAEIIKNKTGGTYDYFPKIFKYNDESKKYDFIGGYDKLQTII
jgi:glutaredoxin